MQAFAKLTQMLTATASLKPKKEDSLPWEAPKIVYNTKLDAVSHKRDLTFTIVSLQPIEVKIVETYRAKHFEE